MKNGIVFIWSEKEMLSGIFDKMEKLGFSYIENMSWIFLDKKGLNLQTPMNEDEETSTAINLTNIIPNQLFFHEKSKIDYFCKTKRILLLFRKVISLKQLDGKPLELRHQRTPDVFFDISDFPSPSHIGLRMQEQVYQMIETLLPKAALEENIVNDKVDFKMVEL